MPASGGPGARFAAVAVASAMVLCAGAVRAAQWEFTPRVEASLNWTDNVTAAPDGLEESEWISALSPGFTLLMNGPRGQMDLSYDAQALWYQDNSDFNDVYHNLAGTGQFIVVPNRLFIDGFALYNQQNIDPAGRITSGNLLRTGNRTDAGVYGFSPWYTQRFGNWGEALVRYFYQGVRYNNTDDTSVNVQDSDTNRIQTQLGSLQDKPGLSWKTAVDYQRTEFDFAPEFKYGRAALDLGYPVGLRSRVTVTGGLESDFLEDRSGGGFDEAFWLVGYAWNPTERQSFAARVGERFFGTTFDLQWRRRGTRGDLSVSYTEVPSTPNQDLWDGENPSFGGRPGSPTLAPDVYLRKRLAATSTYNLTRTQLAASLYAENRERATDEGLEDDVYGLRLSADWDAAPRTTLNAFTRFEYRDFGDTLDASDLYEIGVGIRRQMTRTFHGEFRVGHLRRDFDSGEDYSVNGASLTVGAEF